MPPSKDMAAFTEKLKTSRHIIVVAGAGLSAASGIPTFRGAGGMWRKYDAMSLATPEAFSADPARVWQFYHYRREKALKAQPNAAHEALALFSIPSIRHKIAPNSSFTLITQNVDGLSPRALSALLAAHPSYAPELRALSARRPPLLEMHGRLFDVRCSARKCAHAETNYKSPVVPALQGTEDVVEAGAVEPNIALADLPRCAKCGALARPGVVWFGEQPWYLEDIETLVSKADMCIVVGTSSTVQPAAGYAGDVHDNGGTVAVFNLDRSTGDEQADFLFLGPCEQLLPKALNIPSSAKS